LRREPVHSRREEKPCSCDVLSVFYTDRSSLNNPTILFLFVFYLVDTVIFTGNNAHDVDAFLINDYDYDQYESANQLCSVLFVLETHIKR